MSSSEQTTRSQVRLRAGFRPSSRFVCNILAISIALSSAQPARAGSYDLLKEKADTISQANRIDGLAYVISGGIVVAASIPAYYLSEDVFARGVYSVGQTLGVAAVGYGSYLMLIENDYTRFKGILDQAPDLTPKQRDHLSGLFLLENAERARRTRKIRFITHSLTAVLNLTNAFTSSQNELKTALFFLGGINVIAALSAAFRVSEEEKLAGRVIPSRRAPSSVELVVGQVNGVRFSF